MCRDVAWIHHRQTQWYETWHFAICLSPINVFSRRFLVPSPPLLPNTHTTEQSPTWEHCWAWAAELEASHLRDATASTTASRSQLRSARRQCKGTPPAEHTRVSTTIASHWVFLPCLTSRNLHTRWLKKEKEMGIQTFHVIEGKCESLLYRFSSYQIRLLTCKTGPRISVQLKRVFSAIIIL